MIIYKFLSQINPHYFYIPSYHKLISKTSILPHIRDISKKCVPEIVRHKLGVEGREILWDQIMSRSKTFAYFVERITQHSYYQTIQKSTAAGI